MACFGKIGTTIAFGVAALALSACGGNYGATKVASYPSEYLPTRINVYEYSPLRDFDGDLYQYGARQGATSGSALSSLGVLAAWVDTGSAAEQHCESLGKRINQKVKRDGESGATSAGTFFNCL